MLRNLSHVGKSACQQSADRYDDLNKTCLEGSYLVEESLTRVDSDDTSPATPQLVVPAYFHPAVRAQEWASIAEHAPHIRMIVLNPDSGPGDQPDESFVYPLRRLHSAGVPVAGYVDTNYGHRSVPEVRDDFGRYIDWYGVSAVFFDRVPTAAENVDHYAALTLDVRGMGARVVAFNHGAQPVEAYAEHADLLGTFEGPWYAYIDAIVPRWARSRPSGQFFHLIYSVPPQSFSDAFLLAARRRVGCVYVTDHGGVNPWDRLPACEFDPQLY